MSRTVLLIDDSALQLRMREAVLRQAGFRVAVATTADSALALLTSPLGDHIGAVVTDHLMPQATGVDLVRKMRELRLNVPVIVISGLPGAEDEYQGLNVVFRQKPCLPAELIALVRRLIQQAA